MDVSQGKTRGFRRTLPAPYLESGDINPAALRFYRTQHGLSETELARLLHMSRNTVSNVERGKRRPNQHNEHVFYNFMMATASLMAECDGVVPPSRSFRHLLSQPPEYRDPFMVKVTVERDRVVSTLRHEMAQLERENEELRRQLHAYKSGDYLRRIDEARDQIELVRQEVLRNLS